MNETSDFIKYRPEITEVAVVEAAQAWGVGDEILSLNWEGNCDRRIHSSSGE